MAKKTGSIMYTITTLIVLSASNLVVVVGAEWKPTWSTKAAEEAEKVAAITCSGHGRANLDGFVLSGHEPVCECNQCYNGSDCSKLLPDCAINVESGELYFFEPFWMKNSARSAVLVSGYHRMGYTYRYSDGSSSYISKLLVSYLHRLHETVGNAVTRNKYIIFGGGATQLLKAAVYALSPDSSANPPPPAKVVTTAPFYPLFRKQTELFNSRDFRYEGDTSLWKNNISDNSTRFIEFVASPTNPEGKLSEGILNGSNVKTIDDRAYYWPHFTPIPSPADEDLMVFTFSKLTGHAGSRLGWAIIKDNAVYQKMLNYIGLTTVGVSREAQLRAIELLNVVLEGDGRNLFDFGYETMRNRWTRLQEVLSKSKRFSLQKLSPNYCSFYKRVREPSPAYAWVKCERAEEKNCYEIIEAAGIISHPGSYFGVDDRHVRFSLVGVQDDFEILINKLKNLVAKDNI
ncbi:hypothetical protein RIF29_18545 [Crotalaria pallida]|uniref:Alliinase n=1 Tax=Crotalaria pallida TaxID=3830 RepID=A0AAN9FJ83_CROPI